MVGQGHVRQDIKDICLTALLNLFHTSGGLFLWSRSPELPWQFGFSLSFGTRRHGRKFEGRRLEFFFLGGWYLFWWGIYFPMLHPFLHCHWVQFLLGRAASVAPAVFGFWYRHSLDTQSHRYNPGSFLLQISLFLGFNNLLSLFFFRPKVGFSFLLLLILERFPNHFKQSFH